MDCTFTNDNNTHIVLPEHGLSCIFTTRNFHEVLFRKIINHLIITNTITKNIIDLGAWIGDNSIPWAKNTASTIYAIDPSPVNCNFIKEVSSMNNITNIKVIQKAISDKNEILTTNDDYLFHCTFISNNEKLIDGINKCEATTLDYLHEVNDIDNIGFIHLDVESMEFSVIIGANNIIDKFRPIIAFEQHLDTDNYIELSKHISDKKFVVYVINEVLPGCRSDCRNFIAFPNEILSNNIIETLKVNFGNDCISFVC